MLKGFLKKLGIALIALFLVHLIAYAQAGSGQGSTSAAEPKNPTEASFQSRCANHKAMNFPECATSPAKCGSEEMKITDEKKEWRTPFNCLFLQEPIGGKPGYDLYRKSVDGQMTLWYGEAIVGKDSGPFQAILVWEAGKETQGPFGLVYNYLGLVYNFMSGIIIGFVILMTIVGGVQMSTSAGNADGYGKGKDRIVKAMVGMILWFTASVILYTINPTFFSF